MAASAPLILVVGMHRSGTSLLGSMLPHLGVTLPGSLIRGDQHNPEGYYERHDVTALQEQLLIDLGHWWPCQQGVLPLPADWLEHPATLRCKAALRRVLRHERKHQSGIWAIKDPRTSLLLPLWIQLGKELGLPIQVVLSVRHPQEVTTSLVQRDRDAAGMTAWRAQQLWWRHNLQVLRDATAAELPLQVLHYEQWFNKQALPQLQLLHRFCHGHVGNPDVLAAALGCVKHEHRRSHRPSEGQPFQPMHPRVMRLQKQLQTISSGKRSSQQLVPWLERQPLPLTLPLSRLRGHQPALPLSQLPQPEPPPPLPGGRLLVLGTSWHDWQAHAWLQHLPCSRALDQLTLLDQPPVGSEALPILHLQPVPRGRQERQQLRNSPAVYDPDPERCRQLRCLGVKAHWLRRQQPTANDWLSQVPLDAAAQELGLPPLAALAATPQASLCLGSGGIGWDQQCSSALWCLPGFDQLKINSSSQAQLLAAWLNQVQQLGITLIRLQPSSAERERRGFKALLHPTSAPAAWLAVQGFSGEISQAELLAELEWQRQDFPAPPPCPTAVPKAVEVWQHNNGSQPSASICISLYNYSDRIERALTSAWQQSDPNLELIVVDDASTDDSLEKTRQWLAQKGRRFCSAILLQHTSNAGLAAARNTAFNTAHADWCFVLDADNELMPEAVERCLAIARACPDNTAVVHPLVGIHYSSPDPMPRSFIATVSWQRQQFLHGNVVDAMALVRRSAWQSVGGYTHIPGGWEDFDFWCQLIEAGFHGVLCPQRLAIYHCHGGSMAATGTRLQERRLSRLLQTRHPWLELPKGRVGEDAPL